MTPLQGWLSYGTLNDDGAFVAAEHDRVPWSVMAEEIVSFGYWLDVLRPVGLAITHACIYDAAAKGKPLVHWKLLEPRVAPTRIPPHLVWTDYGTVVRYAITSTATSAGVTSPLAINKGDVLGRCNGQSMVACCALAIVGGAIVARTPHHRKAVA